MNLKKKKERKTVKTKTKQTTRTGREPEKWTLPGGFSLGRGKEGKGTGKKKHNWQASSRWGEVKNGRKQKTYRTYMYYGHGHKFKGGRCQRVGGAGWRVIEGEKLENCNSIINKIYFKNK